MPPTSMSPQKLTLARPCHCSLPSMMLWQLPTPPSRCSKCLLQLLTSTCCRVWRGALTLWSPLFIEPPLWHFVNLISHKAIWQMAGTWCSAIFDGERAYVFDGISLTPDDWQAREWFSNLVNSYFWGSQTLALPLNSLRYCTIWLEIQCLCEWWQLS